MFDINNYVEVGNNIIFDYRQGKFLKTVWYDIRSQKTRITDYLHNDLICKNESIAYIRNFSDGKGVYEVIGEIYFPYFLEIVERGRLLSDLDKREELIRLTDDSNPVVFYYEGK